MKKPPQSPLQALLVAPVGEQPPAAPQQKSMWPLILFGAVSAGLLYALLEARREVARKKDLIEQLFAERVEQGLPDLYPDEPAEDPVERVLLDTFF